MTGPFTAPVLAGSTFVTANTAAPVPLSGPIRPPATQPVFDPANIELQRRMRFNPLRALDPQNLSIAHDQFDLGILRQAALLWDAMIRRDDTLSFVVPQFCNAVAGKPWGVFKKKNADPVEAARHAAALEYCYANLSAVNAFDRNERGDRHLLLKQMGLCYALKYAVHHFVWKPQPGEMIEIEVEGRTVTAPKLTAELEFVPLWFFENVSGTLRFLPFGGFGIQGQELDWEGEWMVTTGEGLMFAAASSYVFKRLGFQDWTTFNERYALPKIVGMTNAQKDSPAGAAMTEIVNAFNGDMGVVIHECQPGDKPPIALLGPDGAVSVDIFERFIDRQDKKMTVMFRGGDKRNIAGDKADSGVSAQISETEAMELAHCAAMASACRAYIDRAVIRYCFGEGVEPLAWFGLPDMDAEDAQQLRESAGFLADRGAKVELDTVAERLGVTLCEDAEDALQPAGSAAAQPANEPQPGRDRTANSARLSRLQQLVEEALRTGNAPFDESQHPRGEHGQFVVSLTGKEFGADLDIHSLRVAAREHLNSLRGKFITHEQTQTPILIDRTGAREAVSKFRQPEELQAIAGIEHMIARSSYVGSTPDKDGSPDIKAWHEYEAPAEIAGQAHRFTIKVRELHDGHRFYDSFSQKSGPGAKSGTTSETLGGPKAPSPKS